MDSGHGREPADGWVGSLPAQEAFSAVEFAAAVDRPAGRIDGVLSTVTGQPLRYFTPDPLADLLQRCRLPASLRRSTSRTARTALMLVAAASTKDGALTPDPAQARRFARMLVAPTGTASESALIALAKEINPSISGLRKEIVFTGGRSSSSARHIYAPPDRVVALLAGLSSVLTGDEIAAADPLLASTVVGMYCSFSHPFVDGNGRWARLVSASTWRTPEAAWPAMVGALFQNACKDSLTQEVWPRAMSAGMREYLRAALAFESELDRELSRRGVFAAEEALDLALSRAFKNRKQHTEAAVRLLCGAQLPVAALREAVGISLRAANGLAQQVVDATHGVVEIRNDGLHASKFCREVSDAIRDTVAVIFNND